MQQRKGLLERKPKEETGGQAPNLLPPWRIGVGVFKDKGSGCHQVRRVMLTGYREKGDALLSKHEHSGIMCLHGTRVHYMVA